MKLPNRLEIMGTLTTNGVQKTILKGQNGKSTMGEETASGEKRLMTQVSLMNPLMLRWEMRLDYKMRGLWKRA